MSDTTQSELWIPSGVDRAIPQGRIAHYRKAPPPAKGPSFEGAQPDWWLGPMSQGGGSPVLMFDLSKLTWLDYNEMRWHPQVNASLSLMTFMLHQIDWHIECEDQKIADLVEENLRLVWPQLVRGIGQAYWAGYSPMVLEWENTNDDKTFISKIKDLHPAEANVHWRYEESNYVPPPEYRNKGVTPKVRVFDGMDKLGLDYPIPPEHTFWYPVLRENNDYTGRKLLKAAFAPWYFSHLMHLYSNRYFERFGEPVMVGRYPSNEEFTIPGVNGADDVRITSKQVVNDAILGIRSGSSVTLPSERDESASGAREYEYDIEYLESQMRGVDFDRYIERLDEEISLAIFTPLLLMRSGDRGSLNLGVQHTKTWLWSLNALGLDLKEYLDPYICERIKAVNFSPNAPKCEWVPRSMGKDNDETLRSMVVALITQGHAKPSIEELGTALGMTLEEITELNPVQKLQQQQKEAASANGADTRTARDRTDRGPKRTSDGPSNTVGGSTPRTVR